jgi:hypothetical protein
MQKFRSFLEQTGVAAKTGNVESIPGGGLRFGMTISRGAAKTQ